MAWTSPRATLHVELLTPKQNSRDLEGDLDKFATKYTALMESGCIASITDNPMGMLSYQATEVIPELGLPVLPEQLLIHLSTFHTREALDGILHTAIDMGARYLLAVSGDGSERLPKLQPDAIGAPVQSVTSVELIEYIHREYPERFVIGAAFNPYEPQGHELEKMARKVAAGAAFIITQPVLGFDPRVQHVIDTFGLPVIIDAWMSKNLHLLSECVGYDIPEGTPYDPLVNLASLKATYPECGLYLALLGFKTQLPLLNQVLLNAPQPPAPSQVAA